MLRLRVLTLVLCATLWACGAAQPPTSSSAPESLTIAELIASDAVNPGRQLVAFAQRLLGNPYRYGGADPAGFDCSGLVYFVHREAGYPVPRTSREQYRAARRVSLERLSPGDLVFFNISANKVSHVGIYVDEDLFIHSPSSGKGVSYASLTADYWRARLVGAGRFY